MLLAVANLAWPVMLLYPEAGVGSQQAEARNQKWVASWAASAHGPYPSGNASAQPVLDFAFESAERGATDQTFRLILKPDLWGSRVRLRFSNAFGTQPVTFDDAFVGLQSDCRATSCPAPTSAVTFDKGKHAHHAAAGRVVVQRSGRAALRATVRAAAALAGRKLAVSFHVARVDRTDDVARQGADDLVPHRAARRQPRRGRTTMAAFPYTTTSWYFLDAIDVMAPEDTAVVACFGDSITDGTASTLNGDDRWPDVLSRRLHAAHGESVAVVNAGIGGNQVVGPASYSAATPFAGGPSALDRLDRDVLGLSGLTAVVWLEGINDLSAGTTPEAVIAGLQGRRAAAAGAAGLRVIGATITSSLGATTASGTPENDARRKAVNDFIRTGGLFDGVADFDAATRDPQTGALRAPFQPNSTTGGAGDRCIRTAPATRPWGTPSTSGCWRPPGKR